VFLVDFVFAKLAVLIRVYSRSLLLRGHTPAFNVFLSDLCSVPAQAFYTHRFGMDYKF